MFKKIPWNKGLTKETNQTLREAGKKVSKTKSERNYTKSNKQRSINLKNKYKNGEIIIWNKGLILVKKDKDLDFNKYLISRYNITLQDYNFLLIKQKFLCALCNKKTDKKLCVDHDHITGKVRGLLCTVCNTSLGRFGDNITGINKIFEYLGNFKRGLDYKNISLISQKVSDIHSRKQITDIYLNLFNTKISIPLICSPMPDVSSELFCESLHNNGTFGIIHRFQTIDSQEKSIKNLISKNCIVGGAVGIKPDEKIRAKKLYINGCRIFCVDTANGGNIDTGGMVKYLKDTFENIFIIAGNVASLECYNYLEICGADAIRVGIGNGSVCKTKEETGIYSPMVTAIMECSQIKKNSLLIADGGIKTPADMCKALAVGADLVMSGGIFAGTKETPGRVIKIDNKKYKMYRGASSHSVQKDLEIDKDIIYNEGDETLIELKGNVSEIISKFKAGLQSSMSYCNAHNIIEYRRNVEFLIL